TIVAEKIGLVPQQVFKTLVARGSRAGVVMAGVAADMELDLKALAKIASDKKLELVAVKELLSLTGYIRGGVSPLGVKKRYPFYLDATALEFPVISISAGRRGLQVLLSPVDLTKITSATVAKIGVRL
ncbi:MAG: aminoacyl-tRNA deacylase, partial [Blastocatellia bacterium]|nr:aminoacyl-tRNA deacylase [Blastocatellia bacterium]